MLSLWALLFLTPALAVVAQPIKALSKYPASIASIASISPIGSIGSIGPTGPIGSIGPTGPIGPIGPAGFVSNWSEGSLLCLTLSL